MYSKFHLDDMIMGWVWDTNFHRPTVCWLQYTKNSAKNTSSKAMTGENDSVQ